MMKKVKWTCQSSKIDKIECHFLEILGLKIALLALKVRYWQILLKGTDLGHSKFKASL